MYSKSEIAAKLVSTFTYEESVILEKVISASGKNEEMIPLLDDVISKMILSSEGEALVTKLQPLAEQFVNIYKIIIIEI